MAYPAKTERNKKLLKDRRGGMTITALAEKYGISKQAVWEVIQRYAKELSTL